jgi:hypothetical protein
VIALVGIDDTDNPVGAPLTALVRKAVALIAAAIILAVVRVLEENKLNDVRYK